MTNFSNLEYELIDHERKLETNTTTTPSPIDLDDIFHRNTQSNLVSTKTRRNSNINSSNGINVPQSLNNTTNDIKTNFTCLIDRNRLVKYTSQSKSFHTFPQSTSIIANMNNFYELLQSMPELSKLEINKKGYTYSYLKQNVVTLSSTTLQQHNSSLANPSENTNNNNNGRSSSTSTTNATTNNNNKNELDKQSTILSKSKSFSTLLNTSNNYDNKSINSRKSVLNEIVDLKSSKSQPQPQILRSNVNSRLRPPSVISNGSNFSVTSPLLGYLQYGDVLIKCNSLS